MNLALSQFTVITGHYGCGKTNLAVNLALDLARQGGRVTVVDLDIVNPYYRSTDFDRLFRENHIELIAPPYANSNLDLPVISAQVFSVFSKAEGYTIFDVGGDDAGAVALGMFRAHFQKVDYQMLYVINRYRYLTRTAAEACALARDIVLASRLEVTGVVNNSNLGRETQPGDIDASAGFANEVCKTLGVPLICTAAMRGISADVKADKLYPVDNFIKNVWD